MFNRLDNTMILNILSFIIEPVYKLVDWINPNKLSFHDLSENPKSYYFLYKNKERKTINWSSLSSHNSYNSLSYIINKHNTNTSCYKYSLLDTTNNFYINKIDWYKLSKNNNDFAVDYLLKNKHKIKFDNFSLNTNDRAVDYLLTNTHKINYTNFSINSNDKAVNHIIQNFSKQISNDKSKILSCTCSLNINPIMINFLNNHKLYIDWYFLSSNSSDKALDILLNNKEKIVWHQLSKNTNKRAIELLQTNLNKIDWHNLSLNSSAINILENNIFNINWYNISINPAAIDLLYKHKEKINWNNFSKNPGIFIIDNIETNKLIKKYLFS